MKPPSLTAIEVALLLSIGLFIAAVPKADLAISVTKPIAPATEGSLPLLGEPVDVSDDFLPALEPSHLEPAPLHPSRFIAVPTRSASQTADPAKRDLKLYRLNDVWLI